MTLPQSKLPIVELPRDGFIPNPTRRLVQDHKSSARWLQIILDAGLVAGLIAETSSEPSPCGVNLLNHSIRELGGVPLTSLSGTPLYVDLSQSQFRWRSGVLVEEALVKELPLRVKRVRAFR